MVVTHALQQLFLKQAGVLHFVGIGGIGMSGIAEILHSLGCQIQGSDIASNQNTTRLSDLGIKVFIGQSAENIINASFVVRSSAVGDNNPEITAAKKQSIPVISRAEMLSEIVKLKTTLSIAGTHGKTTTTTMAAAVFDAANLDPTVINGGIINAYGSNARLGKSDWLILEADESDGTFIRLPSTFGVITNIDQEHIDHYGSFEALKKAFATFISQLPFFGMAAVCMDDANIRAMLADFSQGKILTYAIDHQADVMARHIKQDTLKSEFDVVLKDKITGKEEYIPKVELAMPGRHNILNALAIITLTKAIGIENGSIYQAFRKFKGVQRRFTKVGSFNDITIIDDYGHHPTEIKETLKTAVHAVSHSKGRVIAVFKPHRYTRVEQLFDSFVLAFSSVDMVVVLPIYAAGETPIKGIDNKAIADAIVASGNVKATSVEDEEELVILLHQQAKNNDFIVCLGAGSITKIARALPERLETYHQNTPAS